MYHGQMVYNSLVLRMDIKLEEKDVLQSYAKPEETLAERMERERLAALEKED